MSENTPASGDPTPDNLPEPAPAADESATPPPPPPPPAPEVPPAPPAPEAPTPAPYQAAPPPAYQAAPPPAPAYAAAPAGPKNNQATWSLVLGILSIFCCGLVAGIPAIILGNNGKKIAAQTGVGAGMAQAGFILGIIGTVLTTIGLIGRFTFLKS